MDISFLIPSKMRRQLLWYFVENPDAQVHIRQLARELKASPQQTYRELLNLEGWGFLFSSSRGNQRAFRLNKKFYLYPPIQDLFERIQKEEEWKPKIVQVYDWKELAKKYKKIPVSEELKKGLQGKRNRPRAYSEEKAMKKKGML